MKYRNVKTQAHGLVFDSAAEARRYGELMLLQRAGRITQLQRQFVFVLAPGVKLYGEKRTRPSIRYLADFSYTDAVTKEWIVEDVKGMDTPLSRLKRHLVRTIHNVDVRLVK